MTLEEFAELIKPIPAQDMGKLFLRFDIDSIGEAIEKRRAEQQEANLAAEADIQALTAQREELRRQALGL